MQGEYDEAYYKIMDCGTFSKESMDYPDIAEEVARLVLQEKTRGFLICGTGIGVAIAANKIPGIRAAVCHNIYSARLAREHNDANILTLGARVTGGGLAIEIVKSFIKAEFQAGRHLRRVEKISRLEKKCLREESSRMDYIQNYVKPVDPEVAEAIEKEEARQNNKLELIASENFVSRAVMAAQGSVMTNKYAEGLPGARYYGGCEYVDIAEELARDRVKKIFGAEHANVQPHSGAQANTAVYFAALQPGQTIMGMNLNHGGHLTHGSKVNISGKYFNIVDYGVSRDTERIDYEEIRGSSFCGYGPYCWPGGCRPSSQPGSLCRFCILYYSQDFTWTPGRIYFMPARVGQQNRQSGFPRYTGRAFDACNSSQGRLL